jgi:hypothetical protein
MLYHPHLNCHLLSCDVRVKSISVSDERVVSFCFRFTYCRFLHHEGGGVKFLRNISEILSDCTV